jgi:hypothetical protein
MTFYIAPIVEGQTEAGCIERLLQRVWTELLAAPLRLQVLLPSRCKRDALINPDCPNLAKKVEEAYSKLAQRLRRDPSGRGVLLLLLDAEGDCAEIPEDCGRGGLRPLHGPSRVPGQLAVVRQALPGVAQARATARSGTGGRCSTPG